MSDHGSSVAQVDASPETAGAAGFRARVVLIGASNLTRGISTVIETCGKLLESPLDIYCLLGHGRSYGHRSFVLCRSIPGVLESRAWEVLDQQPLAPTFALITDIGNDVMYRNPPAQITTWVRETIERLEKHDARIVMTALPIPRLERLTKLNYLIARTLFFPKNRMTMEEARRVAGETDRLVRELAAEKNIPVVDFPDAWYGADPIHVVRSSWAEAWGTTLAHWFDERERPMALADGDFGRWLRLRTLSPEQWWLFDRIERGRPQPALTLRNGTRVSFY